MFFFSLFCVWAVNLVDFDVDLLGELLSGKSFKKGFLESVLLNARLKSINERMIVAILAVMFALLIALIESGSEIDRTASILHLYKKYKSVASLNRAQHG
ncbi:hypothetical protein QUA13_30140 [Microcoleus sp. S28C3]|uniref:hypothetical protein n=1 Tax=Microcoleus sp. S28C3 TaxID=3055414 RepID=UPI002FD2F630